MSKWIKNRRPTAQDADDDGLVWRKWCGQNQKYPWWHVRDKEAWRKIDKPQPYVTSNRWQMEWDSQYHQWLVRDAEGHIGAVLCSDSPSPEKYREAAERIAAIYNEVMP